eukprot:jgi/Psemu1/179113/e_gw1.7.168.1
MDHKNDTAESTEESNLAFVGNGGKKIDPTKKKNDPTHSHALKNQQHQEQQQQQQQQQQDHEQKQKQQPEGWRVKLYRLNADGSWDDCGTGRILCLYKQKSSHQQQPNLNSNRNANPRILLRTRILLRDAYQRQGDNIITWCEPYLEEGSPAQGVDLALSFQENEGCINIWRQITQVQAKANEKFRLTHALFTFNTQQNIHQRESLATYISQNDCYYLKSILSLFPPAEAKQDLCSLTSLAACVKTILLLNDPSILESIVNDELVFEDICTTLEYDPDLRDKANHRWFLRERAKFRTVALMKDEFLIGAIHRSFRVNYVKDTLLRPTMDESSLSTLSSLQTFTHADVVKGVTMSPSESDDRGDLLRDSYLAKDNSMSSRRIRRRGSLSFLRELFNMVRISLHQNDKDDFFAVLVSMEVDLSYTKEHQDTASPDEPKLSKPIIAGIAMHDPSLIRRKCLDYYASCKNNEDVIFQCPPNDLLASLIFLLAIETDAGLLLQVSEIMRIILDTDVMGDNRQMNAGFADEAEGIPPSGERFEMGAYQEEPMLHKVPFSALRSSFAVELLSFCVRAHQYRMKMYLLRSRVLGYVLKLIKPSALPRNTSGDRCLKLAALRFLRAVLSVDEDLYHRHIIQDDLFGPVFEAFRANPVGDNLVSSSIVEMCDFINTKSINSLIEYIVTKHISATGAEAPVPSLEDVSSPYVSTLTCLRHAYETLVKERNNQNENQACADRANNAIGRPRVVMNERAIEDQRRYQEEHHEQSYFDRDDDDDEE